MMFEVELTNVKEGQKGYGEQEEQDEHCFIYQKIMFEELTHVEKDNKERYGEQEGQDEHEEAAGHQGEHSHRQQPHAAVEQFLKHIL